MNIRIPALAIEKKSKSFFYKASFLRRLLLFIYIYFLCNSIHDENRKIHCQRK